MKCKMWDEAKITKLLKSYTKANPLAIVGLLSMLVVPCFFVRAFGSHWAFGIPIGILLIVLALFIYAKCEQ